MAFTQSCFIRKNTPELRKKLEDLGYEPCHPMTLHPDLYKHIYVYTFWGDIYYGLTDIEDGVVEAIENKITIDCGTNEEMFLALAALRDDNDYNQWFVSDNNQWFLNLHKTFRKDIVEWCCDMNAKNWKKSTVLEIIEHFSK